MRRINYIVAEKTLGGLIATLVLLLPVTMGTVSSAASSIAILLLLISLFFCWSEWAMISKAERVLCWMMLATFLVALLSFLNTEDIEKSWTRLERLLRLLAFVPIFLMLRKIKVNLIKPLTLGMVFAGPLLLVSALSSVDGGRSWGAYNPILFGDYSAIVCGYLLIVLVCSPGTPGYKLTVFLSMNLAAIALIMSGTRGAWGAIIPIVIWCSHSYVVESATNLKRFTRLILLASLLFMTFFLARNNEIIVTRLGSTAFELQNYLNGSNPHTSLGDRFQMWEAAINIWLKNPLLGTGLGDYSIDLKRMIETGESQMKSHFGEAHGLLFEFLATTGIFGALFCLVTLFLLPIWIFHEKQIPNDNRFVKYTGTLVVLSFFVFGLTQNWLGRSSMASTYIVLLAIFLSSKNRSASPN